MNTIDKKILQLIELLMFEKEVLSIRDFCKHIEMLEQTVTKIKKGTAHFTVLQIESICRKFNVNANWIFNDSKNMFNTKTSTN